MMLAATAPFKAPSQDHVLFWAETGGNLFKPDDDGWLAVMSVEGQHARFVAEADLTATVAGLHPAEQLFYDLLERLGENEGATRDPSFVDPAFL